MKDLISVIITTYKRSNIIERAIKSVLNQTYKNIEIIVVDDNSNFEDEREKTAKIVGKYKNVIYIQNEKNLGGALARNEGIYKAKGKFIAFLDDDDEYREDKIEKQYNLFLEHQNEKVGLIFSNEKSVDYNKNLIYQQMMECIAPTSFWFVPKKVLKEVNYFEDSPCKQDSILLLKILAQGYTVYKVPENLVIFNKHDSENGISGTKLSNIEGRINYRNWCRKYYYLLDNQKQKNNVEYNFSKELVTLYIINNKKKEAKYELKNMIKIKMLNKETIKSVLKYIFRKTYIVYIKKKSENLKCKEEK